MVIEVGLILIQQYTVYSCVRESETVFLVNIFKKCRSTAIDVSQPIWIIPCQVR